MATLTPKRIEQKWQYAVRMSGLVIAHFNVVSSLEFEFDMTEYHQGGDPDPVAQTPGKRKHAPVTFSAGASEIEDLWNWAQQVADHEGRGLEIDGLRKTIFVDTLAKDGETVLKTKILNRAVPQKFVAGDFDANSSENVIEQLTVVYKNLSKG